MAHDVFISYSERDKAAADAACHALEAASIRCWIAPRDVRPGETFGSAIVTAIRESAMMVVIFSSSSNGSPHVLREVERAVGHGLVIVPMRIENVEPSAAMEYFLSATHWLDALGPDLQRSLDELIAVAKAVLEQWRSRPAGESKKELNRPAPVQTGRPTKSRRYAISRLPYIVAVVVLAMLTWIWRAPQTRAPDHGASRIEEPMLPRDMVVSKPSSMKMSAAQTAKAAREIAARARAAGEGAQEEAHKARAKAALAAAVAKDAVAAAEQAKVKAREARTAGAFSAGQTLGVKDEPGGCRYEGDFLHDLPHGFGVMTCPEGQSTYPKVASYAGTFAKGRWHGLGVVTETDSSITQCEFLDGLCNGLGVTMRPSGWRYEGEFQNHMMHGLGGSTWSNGQKHEGEYRHGTMSGLGVSIGSNGGSYAGEFSENAHDGLGVQSDPDGGRIEGQYRNGALEGLGVCTLANGIRHEGEFRGSKRSGKGVQYTGGREDSGVWNDQELVSREP